MQPNLLRINESVRRDLWAFHGERDMLPGSMPSLPPSVLFRGADGETFVRTDVPFGAAFSRWRLTERPDPPPPFGGRRAGERCPCRPGSVLSATRHHGVPAGPALTLDCGRCGFSAAEDGSLLCPACGAWPDRWHGGTDADPRPSCGRCAAPQPGWPDPPRCD
jgi:hypothetical protein